jgi:GAF domain-containing protein
LLEALPRIYQVTPEVPDRRRATKQKGASGSIASLVGEQGSRSSVGAPIVVEDRLWGVMVAAWKRTEELSADTEEHMAQFTELIATAIANAQSRAELAASRARVVAPPTRRGAGSSAICMTARSSV